VPLHRLLKNLGLNSLHADPQHHGFALALGAVDVPLLDLTNAYRALANRGVVSAVSWLPDDAAPPSTPPVSTAAPGRRVISEGAAWLVAHILADNAAREATFGFDSVLATPFWSAVKTGTSKDMRDNWCIGFSEHYTVGVWVGNASGAPMRGVSGVSGAAPAWAQIMAQLHRGLSSHAPLMPKGVAARDVAFEHGLEPTRTEWFLAGTLPPVEADSARPGLHRVRLALAAGKPRIAAPADGALIAWDPDIPAGMQRITAKTTGGTAHASEAEPTGHPGPAGPELSWRLDGAEVARGPRAELTLSAGRHVLTLLSPGGQVLDEVRYEVRGQAR
jgi:penicillin-binding protein 1C